MPIIQSAGLAKGYGLFSAAALPASFESIATVSGNDSSDIITFSSIPSTYRHLQIRYIGKTADNTTNYMFKWFMRFNGITTTSYAGHWYYGANGTVTAGGSISTSITTPGGTSNASTIPNSSASWINHVGIGIIDIFDYASTTKAKSMKCFMGLDQNNATYSSIVLNSGVWETKTTAINEITINLSPTTSSQGWTSTSKFALYGIKGE